MKTNIMSAKQAGSLMSIELMGAIGFSSFGWYGWAFILGLVLLPITAWLWLKKVDLLVLSRRAIDKDYSGKPLD